MTIVYRTALIISLVTAAACHAMELADDATPCENWTAIAKELGCSAPNACEIATACEEQANAWLECVANDLTQCHCESGDADLNCEGSLKDNEGPANCKTPAADVRDCEERSQQN